MREIAKIHREGVILELEQLGRVLNPKYSLEWFEEVWDQQPFKPVTFSIDDKVVGFRTNIDSEVMLYVDPEYHRQGIGSKLITPNGNVWIIDGNKMAEGFYTKNGYYKTPKSRNTILFDHEVTESLWEK